MFQEPLALAYKIQLIIIFLSTLTLLGSTVCSFLGFKKTEKPLRIFAYYLLLALVIDVSANILAIQKIPNLYLLHIYTLGEFIIISLFYKTLFKEKKVVQKNVWWFICFISLAIVLNTVFLEPTDSFNSNAKSLVQIIFISYGIIYFYTISNGLTLTNQNKKHFQVLDSDSLIYDSEHPSTLTDQYEKSLRLINSAILVYYSGSLFIFMFLSYLSNNDIKIHRGFWIFNASLYFVYQTLLFIAIWKIFIKRTKSLP